MADKLITEQIRDILTQCNIENNILYFPPGQLDRKLYTDVNDCLVNIGFKWNRAKKGHVSDNVDCFNRLKQILDAGISIDKKKKFQQFFTPPGVAAKLVKLADVKNQKVLEPSAGTGNLAKEAILQGAKSVTCVEIDEENYEELKNFSLLKGDFLSCRPDSIGKFDRIVMNPPFTKNQDIKHVEHALNFLKVNGILVAVMMPSVQRNKFQQLINRKELKCEILNIEEGAFKESGTNIKTIIVKITLVEIN